MFERLTQDEVIAAQQAWGQAVAAADVDALLELYDTSVLLFKPTMAAVIRTDEAGARSYFVGGDEHYPEDAGFLHRGYTNVRFESARGPVVESAGEACQDMGHYFFALADGTEVKADYSFSYHKRSGRVLITLHHSSFNVATAG